MTVRNMCRCYFYCYCYCYWFASSFYSFIFAQFSNANKHFSKYILPLMGIYKKQKWQNEIQWYNHIHKRTHTQYKRINKQTNKAWHAQRSNIAWRMKIRKKGRKTWRNRISLFSLLCATFSQKTDISNLHNIYPLNFRSANFRCTIHWNASVYVSLFYHCFCLLFVFLLWYGNKTVFVCKYNLFFFFQFSFGLIRPD